ncbi:ribosome hibernation-promoting factor, HPF/YfiA family [Cyclobacterium marinum]|mgnify:FL=1|uniref:Ribosomal subunit interface protein n=1 Tax=Cyclobacterium marinum (strain ATCC 25205 / DSM 745 / LMG 13164 / NCIMB 1802) TaxID=880070 RepID=G0J3Z8_CYCMS|nr:ribosome-associated translation inhibitor RaiA [Cyclobacterium marinum]AEL26664.1 ribosomal subunit interface protein [Cyclobacterium marinum DSM 745]MBI0400015.1 ribosome-associated translation inhibitor RaiA [Cyclobacterium marinum]MBR9775029.1 ribosome-associated translation inhibitor RaiA [Cytophagales bacterium]|tara:strand:- start:64436 stop:64741 length:306 start_codon:yes stop_codon:yes gene_type:complete
MKLQMHSIHFVADQKLIDFIQRKADKLDTYFDQIIDGEVFMRLDKNDKSENKIVEIKLNVPGKQFFAKSQNDSFEAAADDSIEALRRQIKKHKEKLVLAKQ